MPDYFLVGSPDILDSTPESCPHQAFLPRKNSQYKHKLSVLYDVFVWIKLTRCNVNWGVLEALVGGFCWTEPSYSFSVPSLCAKLPVLALA